MARPPDLSNIFHAGGVTELVVVPRQDLGRALARLTSCHDHVFIVDQSGLAIRLGVSTRGRDCLLEEFRTP